MSVRFCIIAHVSRTVQTKRNIVIARPVTPARSTVARADSCELRETRLFASWLGLAHQRRAGRRLKLGYFSIGNADRTSRFSGF